MMARLVTDGPNTPAYKPRESITAVKSVTK